MVTFGALLARACASTSWDGSTIAAHHMMLGMFPPRGAGRDLEQVDRDALIASSFVFPAAKAKKVEGGYVISGRWPFSSGVDPSEWNMLAGARLPRRERAARAARVPAAPVAVQGASTTGTPAACAAPAARTSRRRSSSCPSTARSRSRDTKGGPTPGSAVNPGPLFQMPVFALFPYMLSGVALGIAEGLIDELSARKPDA